MISCLLASCLGASCSPALHDGQKQLRSVVLQLQDQVHSGLAQWVDVVENEGSDDPEAVGLVGGNADLILVAWTLELG